MSTLVQEGRQLVLDAHELANRLSRYVEAVAALPAAPVVVTVSPAEVTLKAGETQQFTASTKVKWDVVGEGKITPDGLYTAPAKITADRTAKARAKTGGEEGRGVVHLVADVVAAPPPGPPAPPPPEPAPTPDPATLRSFVPDDGRGPTREYRRRDLAILWRNVAVGDWVDNAGVPQGPAVGASWRGFGEPAQWYEFQVTSLARGVLKNGSGILLMANAMLQFAGRMSATPPELIVHLAPVNGVSESVVCPCIANANWSERSGQPVDSRAEFVVGQQSYAVLQFDMRGVQSVPRAFLLLYLKARTPGASPFLRMFELAAPADKP